MRRRFYFDSFLFVFFLAFEYQPRNGEMIPNVDTKPVLLKKVEVVYPLYAYEEKCEGKVVLTILINGDGRVEDLKVVKSSDEIFNEAAITAAKQWLFKPAILNKKPIKFWYNVMMVFVLAKMDSLNSNTQPEVIVLGDSFSIIVVLRDSSSMYIAPQANKIMDVNINPWEYSGEFGVDEKPDLIQRVEPNYPPIAYANRIEGQVIVLIFVDTAGKVSDAKVVKSSNEIFNQDAITCVKQWTFKPAIFNRKPVRYWYADSLYFRIK